MRTSGSEPRRFSLRYLLTNLVATVMLLTGAALVVVEPPSQSASAARTVVNLETRATTANQTSYVTGTVSPAAAPVLIGFHSNPGADPTVSGLGLTWKKAATHVSGNAQGWVYVGRGTPTVGEVTVDFGSDTKSLLHWSLEEVPGPVVQAAGDAGDSAAPTVALAPLASSENVTVGFAGVVAAQPTFTAGTGFTLLGQSVSEGPNAAHATEFGSSETVAFSLPSAEKWLMLAVEVGVESGTTTTTTTIPTTTTEPPNLLSGTVGPTTIPSGEAWTLGDATLVGDITVNGTLVARDAAVTTDGAKRVITATNGGVLDFTDSTFLRVRLMMMGELHTNFDLFPDGEYFWYENGAGPANLRRLTLTDAAVEGMQGGYAIHFHYNGTTVAGSVVEDVTVQNSPGRAFVPHGSTGIRFTRTQAINVMDQAYWWDTRPRLRDVSPEHGSSDRVRFDDSHDIVWEDCLVDGLTKSDPATHDAEYRPGIMTGFTLGGGSGNTMSNCTARNVVGEDVQGGAVWPSQSNGPPNVWTFTGNTLEAVPTGIYVWQNSNERHVNLNTTISGCDEIGLLMGAYGTHYLWDGLTIENCPIALEQHARSADAPVHEYRNVTLRHCGRGGIAYKIDRAKLPPRDPLEIHGMTIVNCPRAIVHAPDTPEHPWLIDFHDVLVDGAPITEGQVELDVPLPAGSALRFFQDGALSFTVD